jgi:predicted short-subunit dehydrogenase-like oxidoreductase (DUF2520 family)
MDIILVGPGRAGLALTLAAREAGHEIVGVLGRSAARSAADLLGTGVFPWDDLLPAADLLIIAVSDDAIADVADRLAPRSIGIRMAVHLSGSVGIDALAPLTEIGVRTGGFHPLQTLPDPETGSRRLEGAWAGITARDRTLRSHLEELAKTLGMRPFPLDDAIRPLYHAGAAAASNYVIGSLALAQRLFEASGVPWEAAGPLVAAVVANAMALGPDDALTGPIARGDAATVAGQREAIRTAVPDLEAPFVDMGRALADLAGTSEAVRSALE